MQLHEIVHRPHGSTELADSIYPCRFSLLYSSYTYTKFKLVDRLPTEVVVASPKRVTGFYGGQEANMKRLMMVMVIGMALAASGFAQERGGEHFSDGRGANGHFSGPAARGGRYDGGFSGYRRGDGGPRVGFGFSFAPAPGYVYPPSYVAPGYCPPVVGGVVVRGGYVRGRAFVGHRRDGRGFRR